MTSVISFVVFGRESAITKNDLYIISPYRIYTFSGRFRELVNIRYIGPLTDQTKFHLKKLKTPCAVILLLFCCRVTLRRSRFSLGSTRQGKLEDDFLSVCAPKKDEIRYSVNYVTYAPTYPPT